MNYRRGRSQYYKQLENGIAEMEATVERLRAEIQELMEMKNALYQLNSLLKKEVKEKIEDFPF
jgi:regulator of replication initiation timing